MNFRRVKHMFLRLSPEEKMAGVGALVVLVSAFLPWFSIISKFENQKTLSGFSGDFGVIGFVIFLLTAMAISFLMAEHLHLRIPNFGFKKDQIILFLMGESAFLLLLTIAVYTKRSFEYTNAEIRFGLYMALIGAFLSSFAAFAQAQKQQKKDTEAFFNHPEETEAETGEINDENINDEPSYKEQTYAREIKKEKIEAEPVQAEQKSFFYEEGNAEDQEAEEDPFQAKNDEKNIIQEASPEEIIHEENIEEPADEPIEEIDPESPDDTAETLGEDVETHRDASNEDNAEDEPAPENPPATNQGDYFVREAGVKPKSNIKVDIESIRPAEKADKAEKKTEEEVKNETMSFYDDL